MKKVLFIGFLFYSLIHSAQEIEWKKDVKLMWDDFKSPTNTSNKKISVASTYCGWKLDAVKSSNNPKTPVKVKVFVYFDSGKSWKNIEKVSDNTLNHERKHFDICELFARKLRKEIKEKIKNSGDFDLHFDKIYEKHVTEYRAFQSNYDAETDHGRELEKQKIFDEQISADLETYKEFANT